MLKKKAEIFWTPCKMFGRVSDMSSVKKINHGLQFGRGFFFFCETSLFDEIFFCVRKGGIENLWKYLLMVISDEVLQMKV
jgi:hypothetical protein